MDRNTIMRIEELRVDYLVLGSGIAGLTFALKVASKGRCLIVTKKEDKEANTNYAQGGIACVIDPEDTFASHIGDTMKAGGGLCKREAVEILVKEGPERVKELVDMGAEFETYKDRDGRKLLRLSREGGHSARRIVFSKDTTGQEIERILLEEIYDKNVEILENHPVIKLISDRNQIYGAWLFNKRQGKLLKVISGCIMLATGGAGRLFLYTTNPAVATGEGLILAYKAGAILKNLEFIQFHPTALYRSESKFTDERVFLITEAVRGEGGILKNSKNQTFMDFHPLKNLAPRDIVAREIDKQIKETGHPCVYLDISHLDKRFIIERFPNIYKTCLEIGIDITKEAIPVIPAAHYFCGGVETDLWGRTNIRGLYASGEVAYTGVHGANRLASNSLLEALVFSHRAALDAINTQFEVNTKSEIYNDISEIPKGVHICGLWSHYQMIIKKTMLENVSIVRNDKDLQQALKKVKDFGSSIKELYNNSFLQVDGLETLGIALLSELVIKSALLRKESRGVHYNIDYPSLSKKLYETCIDLNHPDGYINEI
ncbi:MAG: L-aspartate oxidase [Candidatus Hydrogenedentota bacterium]